MNTLLSGSKGVIIVTVKQATVFRFREIMAERSMKPNELANLSGVTPSTVYSMLDDRRKELSINVINKLCGGIDLRQTDFFNSPLFDELDLELDPPAYKVPFFD